MIKKIQKYLLLHYPTLWNIKLVPMLLILLVAHIIFFAIGYLATSNSFDGYSSYYYSSWNQLGIVYFASILIGILLLIGWLIAFNRNNAIKVFYPKKARVLYLEWLLIFAITSAIALIPFSLNQGYLTKWRSASSETDAVKALDIIEKSKILIPDNDYEFTYDASQDTPIPIPEGMIINIDSINLDLYSFSYNNNNSITINGYKGPSLLFYKSSDYYYYSELAEENAMMPKNKSVVVKQWLRDGQKDSIYALMVEFNKLQQEQNLTISLTPSQWLERIYKPPFFEVNKYNVIRNEDRGYSYYDNYYDNVDSLDLYGYTYNSQIKVPYLQHRELKAGYETVLKSYNTKLDYSIILLCLCISLSLSLFIFSFRATAGKSWLTAFVAGGVLIFISCLLGVALSTSGNGGSELFTLFVCTFWLVLFTILLINIISKTKENRAKGRSNIYINIFLWLLPAFIPLLYFGYEAIYEFNDKYLNNDYIEPMFWINIPVIVIAMWFVSLLVRKWKSTPEE